MKLKNVNPNGDNVVANNLINVHFFIFEIMKIGFKNKDHMLYCLKDAISAPKTKFLMLFTSQIDIE
jgi:hypothetical protein